MFWWPSHPSTLSFSISVRLLPDSRSCLSGLWSNYPSSPLPLSWPSPRSCELSFRGIWLSPCASNPHWSTNSSPGTSLFRYFSAISPFHRTTDKSMFFHKTTPFHKKIWMDSCKWSKCYPASTWKDTGFQILIPFCSEDPCELNGQSCNTLMPSCCAWSLLFQTS